MLDLLKDIHQYNNTLTISQVVRFFDKKGLNVTKSMIQNYVRDGLLQPPVDKRYYTPKHLVTLILVDYLKTVYEMAEIKSVLIPLMDEEGISLEIYGLLLKNVDRLSERWKENMAPLLFDKSMAKIMSLLVLMTHSADLKALSCELIEQTDTPEIKQA